jgi:hypothetical protein
MADNEDIDAWERKLINKQQRAYAELAPAQKYNAARSAWELPRPPQNESEWSAACFARYEDTRDLLASDPFVRKRFSGAAALSETFWKDLYRFLVESEYSLLNSKHSYVPVQRLVRRQSRTEKLQDIENIFVIGVTAQYAVIAATVVANPKDFYLFSLRIDSTEPPKCEMTRRKQAPIDALHTYQLEKDVNATIETSIENVTPVWELVDDSKLRGQPVNAALDPVSGLMVLVCKDHGDHAVVFDLHAQPYVKRLPNIKLPIASPDLLAISKRILAVGYRDVFHIEGDQKKTYLPPLIYVQSLDNNEKWAPYIVPFPSPTPTGDGGCVRTPTDYETVYFFTHLSFHRKKPFVLVIGTEDGGLRLLDCQSLMTSGANVPTLEQRATFYPGPNLMAVYEQYRQAASHQADDRSAAAVLFNMPAPRQQVWNASWTETEGLDERTGPVIEPRITMCLAESIAVVNASEERAAMKVDVLGKKPVLFSHRGSPSLCCEARAGVMVLHDAFTNEILVGELARGLPCWIFNHPDVVGSMPAYGRAYQSLMVFTRRIVILWPNGFVGFVEIADESMLKTLEEETEKRVAERLANLTLNKSEAK